MSDAGASLGRRLDALMDRRRIGIVPLTQYNAEIARAAYQRYGRGHHRTGLKLARVHAVAEPLLLVGNDFAQTDVDAVRY
jgi:ribonuclease VapC